MLAIGVRYLMGWSMAATDGAAKQQPEWPPHPDRLFMALTAACFEADCGEPARAALEWLEAQPSPELACSRVCARRLVTSYVPVNDSKVPRLREGVAPSNAQIKQGVALLPEWRPRQPRHFPVAIPQRPYAYFIWPAATANGHRTALELLCRNVTALGHSASLVQAWVSDHPAPANLIPTDAASNLRLRSTGPGRLQNLVDRYNESAIREYDSLLREYKSATGKIRRKIKETIAARFPTGEPHCLRPEPARAVGYRRVLDIDDAPELALSLFDVHLLVLRRSQGKPLGLESTLLLTAAARKTILSRCRDPIPEWVSGHRSDGKPSKVPHMAIFPLPHVGSEHADGHLLGFAIALPCKVPKDEITENFAWLHEYDDSGQPQCLRVYDGKHVDWDVCLELADFPPRALRVDSWTQASRVWATVTPTVFDRYPKGGSGEHERMIAIACARCGLPEPERVVLAKVSAFQGVPHCRRFPGIVNKTHPGRRIHSHAVLHFNRPVAGPVLLGAGRFCGYGLCRPLIGRREE